MEELDFAIKTVKKAYKKCIKGKPINVGVKSTEKFLNDFVTDRDMATEQFITEQIKKCYPNDNIVSEEFNTYNKCEGRCWVLDPIDGTVNFSRKLPLWNIQLAFVVDGETKCAAIYCPTLDEVFSADENGAYLNGEKITVNKDIALENSIINSTGLVPKNENIFNTQINILKDLGRKVLKVKIFGSSGFEFCMVAANRINAYITFYTYNIWDHIPGIFICKQAGCEIIDREFGDGHVCVATATKTLKDEFEKYLK